MKETKIAEENLYLEKEFRQTLKGCKKKTGYFGRSPYYCGELVQTTPKDVFNSYCRECQRKLKEFDFDLDIIPNRKKCGTHKATCERWLVFLIGFAKTEAMFATRKDMEVLIMFNEKKITDLKQAIKLYEENGI